MTQVLGERREAAPFHLQLSQKRSLRLILSVAFLVLYLATHWSLSVFESSVLSTAPWSPETGLTVAAGFLLGWFSLPFAFAAHLIGNAVTRPNASLPMLLVMAVIYSVVFAGSSTLFREARKRDGPRSTRFLIKFLILSVILSLIAAGLRALAAMALKDATLPDATRNFLPHAVGDLIGILTVAPLLLMAQRQNNIFVLLRQNPFEMLAALSAIVLVSYAVFGLDDTDEFKFFYLLFIPLIFISMRFGLNGAALGVLVSDVAMMAILAVREFSAASAAELQILMVTLATTTLILGSIVSERTRLANELIRSHEKLRESQFALIHASRVSLVGEMATALAHELNQPLASVRNYVRATQRMLERRKIDRKNLQRVIGQAVGQIDSASALIRQTRRFLKRGETPMVRGDIRQIISTSVELMMPELRRAAIEMTVRVPDYLPAVHCNSIQVQQVIINLLRNAKDSIVESDRDTRRIEITAATGKKPGFVQVTVADSGPGLKKGMRENLFKPFSSTKREGLGLGLSLCASIISVHGGELWLEEDGDPRTRFSFTLPFHKGVGQAK